MKVSALIGKIRHMGFSLAKYIICFHNVLINEHAWKSFQDFLTSRGFQGNESYSIFPILAAGACWNSFMAAVTFCHFVVSMFPADTIALNTVVHLYVCVVH